MGTYSDPALILPGAVSQTELANDSKKNVANGVIAAGASKEPVIYTTDHSSQMKLVDALVPTKGASITSFEDPSYTGTDYCSNAYFDGTNWIKYDATIAALSLYHDAASDETSLWRSAVSEAQGQPIANWTKHTILEADVANGIAMISASGRVLSAGNGIDIIPDVSDDIYIADRTAGTGALKIHKNAASDYEVSIKESAVYTKLISDGDKDIASGVAGLDANILLDPAMMYPCVERYNNHLGATDNFSTTTVSGAGAVTPDATNHEMEITTGISQVGHSAFRTKDNWSASTKTLVGNFILSSISESGNDGWTIGYVGFSEDHTEWDPANLHLAAFKQQGAGAWKATTSDDVGIGTDTAISPLVVGDLLTIVVTSTYAKFYVNGVLVATHTVDLPTLAMYPGASVHSVTSSTATAHTFDVDLIQSEVYY